MRNETEQLNRWELPVESAILNRDPGGAGLARLLLRSFDWTPPPSPPPIDLSPLLDHVGDAFHEHPTFQAFDLARQQLADAQREASVLTLDLEQARIDEARLKQSNLPGAELARKVSDLADARQAIAADLARLQGGLPTLRAKMQQARQQADQVLVAISEQVRREHAPQEKTRQEILAEVARTLGPVLDQLFVMPPVPVSADLAPLARQRFLAV